MTKAYSAATVQSWRDELRAIDARVLELEALKRETEARIRQFDLDIGDTDIRELREDLKAAKREQKSLTDKVHRIVEAKEKSR